MFPQKIWKWVKNKGNKILDALKNLDATSKVFSKSNKLDFQNDNMIFGVNSDQDVESLKAELNGVISEQINAIEDKNIKSWAHMIKELVSEKIGLLQKKLEEKFNKRIQELTKLYDK